MDRPGLKPERRAQIEAELVGAPMPDGGAYLWRMFNRLAARRGSNGFGFNPLDPSGIEAFLRLSGLTLAPWEFEVVEMLDDLFLAEQPKTKGKGA